ncbi:MAG: MFS transporter [Bacteroidales bacterium]|nr:MFS transporter [Bacteroidales bacterium]
MQLIFSITLIAVMGVASISPAFPSVIKAFGIESHKIAWLITVFTVPGVVLTPIAGILADRLGRKKILVPSLFIFAIAGSACGFAQSYEMLVIFRFFQGVGAASIGSLNVTLIGDIYSGKDRAKAMGYNASVLSLGTATYPAIGGALAMLGWYWPFFFPVLALPVGLFVLLYLKNPEPEGNEAFLRYLKNAFNSMANRRVIGLFILSVSTFIILYGAYLTMFPLYLGEKFKATPLIIGLIASSMSVTTAITSSRLGRLIKKYSAPVLIIVGCVLYGISLFLIPFLPGLIYMLIPAVIFGAAQGLNIPATQTFLAELSPIEYRAAFMSINGMVLRLGQTLGPLIIGYFIAFGGYSAAFFAGAILAVFMVLIAMMMIK